MSCYPLPFYELNEDGVSLWIGKLCKNGCFVQNIINESTKGNYKKIVVIPSELSSIFTWF